MLNYAVIPAAGLATRFLPASKSIPKEMFPVYDRPVIQYIVEESVNAGMNKTVFVTAEGKSSILDHFDRINPKFDIDKLPDDIKTGVLRTENLTEVFSVRQKNPRGLGHAVLTGAAIVPPDAPYAVLLPDMLLFANKGRSCMERMADIFAKEKVSVIALMKVPDSDRPKYGMAEGNLKGNILEIKKLVEKPAIHETKSNLAIVGRYIFTPAITGILESTNPGTRNEIQLTDAMNTLCGRETMLGLIMNDDDIIFDAGDKNGFAMANAFVGARNMPQFLSTLQRILEK